MIRRCDDRDFELIWTIINDGAQVYQGTLSPKIVGPNPTCPAKNLQHEIDEGVVFWGYQDNGILCWA